MSKRLLTRNEPITVNLCTHAHLAHREHNWNMCSRCIHVSYVRTGSTVWVSVVQGKFINEGLFKYARYPMYFGEILTWTGIAVLCTSALRSWVTIAMAFWSPVFTYCLLVYVSGVPIQARHTQPMPCSGLLLLFQFIMFFCSYSNHCLTPVQAFVQERQAAKRWGTSQAYTEYKKKTYVLLPWPKLKAHSA